MYVMWSETEIRSQNGYYTLDLLRHISSHNYTKHLICYGALPNNLMIGIRIYYQYRNHHKQSIQL